MGLFELQSIEVFNDTNLNCVTSRRLMRQTLSQQNCHLSVWRGAIWPTRVPKAKLRKSGLTVFSSAHHLGSPQEMGFHCIGRAETLLEKKLYPFSGPHAHEGGFGPLQWTTLGICTGD